MNFLRKAVVVTVCSLLPMVLLSFGILFSLYQVLGSPSHIKKAFDESKVYDAVAATLIKQTTSQEGSTGNSQTSSGEAAMRQAISQAIPASYIKQQTSNVLDGIYAWVQGDTQSLTFSVDLTPVKESLVENLTNQAKASAAALPPCGPEAQPTVNDDPFSMNCLPAGATPDQLADKTKQSVLDSEMFKNSSVTPKTLIKEGDKPLDQQLVNVRNGYQAAKKAVYLTGLLAIIFVAIVIFLSRPRQSGIKRVALTLLSVGGVGVITAVVGNFVVKAMTDSVAKKSGDTLGVRAAEAVRILANDLRNWWIILGVLSVIVAVSTLVGIRIWNKKHSSPVNSHDEQPVADLQQTK